MNLLDENFPHDQRHLLQEWRIPFRQIGREFLPSGVQDSDIIPLLHKHRGTTFFTQDGDFFKEGLCHTAYCLVFLDVWADDTVFFVRRLLSHPRFKTKADRMGIVARVRHDGLQFWQRNHAALQRVAWPER